MTCEEAIKLMDGYLDGELDPITNQTIEQHLRECHNCDQAYKTHGSLIRAIGNATPYYKAPAGLRERIQSSLREEIAERPMRNVARDAQPLFSRRQPEPRTILLGDILELAGSRRGDHFRCDHRFELGAPIAATRGRSIPGDATHRQSCAFADGKSPHRRRFFRSAHCKTVAGRKARFCAPVVDLSQQGFPLIGGRLDYLDNRPVAALVYQRRKHFINLFVWPAGAGADRTMKAISRQGYQLLHWLDSEFSYWAVSDISEKELQEFEQLFEEQIAPH